MIIDPEGIKFGSEKWENWKLVYIENWEDFEHKELVKMEEWDNLIIAL